LIRRKIFDEVAKAIAVVASMDTKGAADLALAQLEHHGLPLMQASSTFRQMLHRSLDGCVRGEAPLGLDDLVLHAGRVHAELLGAALRAALPKARRLSLVGYGEHLNVRGVHAEIDRVLKVPNERSADVAMHDRKLLRIRGDAA
jgi:hypothetical protein